MKELTFKSAKKITPQKKNKQQSYVKQNIKLQAIFLRKQSKGPLKAQREAYFGQIQAYTYLFGSMPFSLAYSFDGLHITGRVRSF